MTKISNLKTMVNNHLYDLMEQLVQENKSLWRIVHNYPSDAENCPECAAFWQKMKKDKEDHIAEMLEMLKNHLARD